MGRVKKYIKKQAKRAYGYAKKRYVPGGKIDFGRIAKDVLKLKGIINTERKYKDNTYTGFTLGAVSTSWNIFRLNELEANDGDREGERHGMTVRFKYLQIRGRVTIGSPSTITTPQRVRMILFIDTKPLESGLSGVPTVTELLQTNTLTGGYVNAFKRIDEIHNKRFTVLYDKIYVLDNDDKAEVQFRINKALNMVTSWQQGYTASNAINRNALYVAFVTDSTTAGDVSGEFSSRMQFYDN